jgi:hypothetical protein
MEPIKGTEIDLQLSQEYVSGYLNPYKVYYFDIYLSNTSRRIGYIDLRLGHSGLFILFREYRLSDR